MHLLAWHVGEALEQTADHFDVVEEVRHTDVLVRRMDAAVVPGCTGCGHRDAV